MRTDEEPVVVEQTFATRRQTVWDALTMVEQMRSWYFDNIPAFAPELGFATEFLVVSGSREFPHCWRVTEVEPLQKLAYEWTYRGYAGRGSVTFELFDAGDATNLRLTNTVLEDFPDQIPEFRRESCVAGWEYLIQQRLKEYLEKGG